VSSEQPAALSPDPPTISQDDSLNPLGLLAQCVVHSRLRGRLRLSEAGSLRASLEQSQLATLPDQAVGYGAPQWRPAEAALGIVNHEYFSAANSSMSFKLIPSPGALSDRIGMFAVVPVKPRQPSYATSTLFLQGILTRTEVADLWDIWYTHLHRHLPAISRAIHTPDTTCARSPFLFATGTPSLLIVARRLDS